jgi:hypothetical protein
MTAAYDAAALLRIRDTWAIWPDPQQTYLLSADGENNEIRIIKREDGSVVGRNHPCGRSARDRSAKASVRW